MDRLVPGLEALRHLGFIPTPQAGCDNPGYPTPGTHRITQVAPSTGTVGKDLTRVVRQCLWARPAILGIGRCDGNFLHQRCVGIGTDMGPEAVKGWLAFICSLPDDPISPRRSALFMAGSVPRDVRDGGRPC